MKLLRNILLGALVVVVIIGFLWALWTLGTGHGASPGPVAVAVIVGAACIITISLLITTVYTWLGLSDRTQALGLPDGSVRALIALILLSAFISIPLYLYSSMSAGLKFVDVPAASKDEDLKSLPQGAFAVPLPDSKTFRLYYRDTDPASADFAKEILTALITLVASVSSFYFGAAIAKSSQPLAGSTTPEPVIVGVDPPSHTRGAVVPIKISGRNLELVKAVTLSSGSTEVHATDVTSSATLIKCSIDLPATCPTGKWTIAVSTSNQKSATLEDGFDVQ